MAQGNYVTVPGGTGPNPFKGISESLSDLSKMYTDRSTVDREEALQREKLAEDRRRWGLQNARQQTAADRLTDEYKTQQDMTNWYKNFGTTYNPDEIRIQKAKDYFGATDAELQTDVGRQILEKIPLYQEDVADFYGKKFTQQFGTALDPTKTKAAYSGLSSIQALQAAEDENATRRFETAKYFVTNRISAAKGLGAKDGGTDSKSKTSTKVPRTYNDIRIADLVSDFEGDSFLWTDSSKEDAQDVAKYTLDVFQNAKNPNNSQKYNASQAKAMTEFVLDRLRTGEDLKDINDAKGKIADLIVQAQDGMTDSYKYYDGTSKQEADPEAQAYLKKLLKSDMDSSAFNPRNIQTLRRTQAQTAIDRLRGVLPKEKTLGIPSPKVERPAISKQNENWPGDDKQKTSSIEALADIVTAPPAQTTSTTPRYGTGSETTTSLKNALVARDRKELLQKEATERKSTNTGGTNVMPRMVGGRRVTEAEYNNAINDAGRDLILNPLRQMNTGLNQIADFALNPVKELIDLVGRSPELPGAIKQAGRDFKEFSSNRYPSADEVMARKKPAEPVNREVLNANGDKVNISPSVQAALAKMPSTDKAAQEAANLLKRKYSASDYKSVVSAVATGNPALATKLAVLLEI